MKSELKAMTSASIIFTVFILGGLTFYMMDSLGLAPQTTTGNKAQRETEMVSLLAKSSTDDKDLVTWDSEPADKMMGSTITPAPPPSANIFRQRVQNN